MRRLAIILVLFFSGCCTLNENYVKQDRMNYETLAPRIRIFVSSSDQFTDDQKQDIKDRLEAWDLWTTEGLNTFK